MHKVYVESVEASCAHLGVVHHVTVLSLKVCACLVHTHLSQDICMVVGTRLICKDVRHRHERPAYRRHPYPSACIGQLVDCSAMTNHEDGTLTVISKGFCPNMRPRAKGLGSLTKVLCTGCAKNITLHAWHIHTCTNIIQP